MFDRAARAVVDGDESTLRGLLGRDTNLARARGAGGATLLHYVAANGVEDDLQRTPANAASICRLLLAAGAEPDALMDSYGGGVTQTPLCLLVSSWPPFERGVQVELARTLVAGGAAVDGLPVPGSQRGDGAPLATALVFGYTKAAEALRDLGARTDSVFFAAGLGDVAAVDAAFDERGNLPAAAVGCYRPPFPYAERWAGDDARQEALHFAVTHGRLDVADLLLDRGADPDGTVTGHHASRPLTQALFVREFEAAALLLERNADPDRRDDRLGKTAREFAEEIGGPARALMARFARNGPPA